MIKKYFSQLPSSLKSIIWILVWSASFTFSMTCNMLLSKEITSFTVVFFRSIFGFVVFLPFLIKSGTSAFKTKRLPLHLAHALFSFGGRVCSFFAYAHLPIALATTIGFSAPIFITVMALVILKDKVSPAKWAAVTIGYVGVLIVTAPEQIIFSTPVLIALLGNIFIGSINITVKQLSDTDNTITIMAYINVFVLLVSGAFALANWYTPGLYDLKFLILIGVAATLNQFSYIQALKHGDPATIAPFEYSRIVFAIPVGLFIFQEKVTWWMLLGSLVIIISNYYITRLEAKKKNAKKTDSYEETPRLKKTV